ncbi:MAG: hypothetical protein A3F72_09455 [Bacteroidetes bacterium RIFCSPLOWO2_12_FULL_35_15]|nr:MAG: hypothetical protein A3F72_09455 [Bacteroidetes bacterium RIFCSPLOWO2_12_FULL_35_15]
MLIFILFFTTCKKDDEADYITKETIRGNVRNNCTGKGFANIEVKLLERYEKGRNNVDVNSYTCITDNLGDFTFKDIDIHSSSKYTYAEYIASHYSPEYFLYGIGPLEIEKGHMSIFNQIGISATFKLLILQLSQNVTSIAPDTFTINIQQRTLHYYEPNRVYEETGFPRFFYIGALGIYSYVNVCNYPMGWWHITLDKTKNGVHSVINDSIYLDMGADTSYTIPW